MRSDDRIIRFRDGRNARIEYLLPSGGQLIGDMEERRSARIEIRTDFDWKRATPREALNKPRFRDAVENVVVVDTSSTLNGGANDREKVTP
jgi:hypothetical protein